MAGTGEQLLETDFCVLEMGTELVMSRLNTRGQQSQFSGSVDAWNLPSQLAFSASCFGCPLGKPAELTLALTQHSDTHGWGPCMMMFVSE